MQHEVTLTREQIIERTSTLLQALMRGYILESIYGVTLKVDESGLVWIKDRQGDEWTRFIFDVDIRFLQKEASVMSDTDYQSIRSFVLERTYIKE